MAIPTRKPKLRTRPHPSLEQRIYGCWMGKSIGGTLGLPVEGKTERMALTFYDPIPKAAPPNDDLELQLIWLTLVEKSKGRLTRKDFADAWLRNLHYMWDEYGRCRWNLRRGVPLEAVGAFENWFGASMGSPIRSELWACLFAGDPASAAWYAALDASLDHGTEGIYGEAFLAAMQSLVAAGADLKTAIVTALRHLLSSTETAQAALLVIANHDKGLSAWKNRDSLVAHHNHENFTHAPLNVALIVWALLHGNGDFGRSILLSTNAGYDTDSTAATVGATLGLALGLDAIPPRWKKPIGDGVFYGPGVRHHEEAPRTLAELTRRVLALIGRLEVKSWKDISWPDPNPRLDLASLPGTIAVTPLHSTKPVPWANLELPAEVKRAGGAEWTWDVASSKPRHLICLARSGARLYVDGKLVVKCPPGLPFVPATHRGTEKARVLYKPRAGKRHVRLELDSQDEKQDAAVILTYPNFHICPWTRGELPNPATLADA